MKIIYLKKLLLLLFSSLLFSCSDSSETVANENVLKPDLKGSGFFEYTNYAPLAKQPVKVFFNIPANSNTNTPIVYLFHGDDRNASEYRDALIAKSEQYNFIILAPEFSEQYYPIGDKYNLGNVFVDGDNPTPETLNREEVWTFSIIEPLFDYFKNSMLLNANSYHIIGHSAGGQFAHRFVMFKPNARFNTVVASASGWYTVPDLKVDFPYGFVKSPLANLPFATLFSKKLYVQIGLLDNDSNSPGLRHNAQADAQGLNRLTRANYFFDFSKNLALQNNLNFQWQITRVAGLDHNYIPAVNYAADLIFK
jgi:hypothetical protein